MRAKEAKKPNKGLYILSLLVLIAVFFNVVVPRNRDKNFIVKFRPNNYVHNFINTEEELLKGINALIKTADTEDITYTDTEEFVKALSQNMQIRRICNKNPEQCFGYGTLTYENSRTKSISSIKTPSDIGLDNNKFYTPVAFTTKSGKSFFVSYKKDCILAPKEEEIIPSCIAGIYDINGSAKPNKFSISLKDKNDRISDIKAFNGGRIGNCAIRVDDLCVVAPPFYPTPLSCDSVKDEFGIKNCTYNDNDDYWAGALKQCKDIGGHLATPDELAKFASAIYGKTISPKENIKLKINKDVTNALGLNFVYRVPSLWSSEEKDGETAYIRSIIFDHSNWSDDERNISYQTKAICIKN